MPPRPRQSAQPPTPPPPAWQEALARASRPLLTRLTALPRPVVPILLGLLLLGGLVLPAPWALVPLLLVAAFLGWLLALAWPRLDATGRLVRGLVVVLVLVLAVSRTA